MLRKEDLARSKRRKRNGQDSPERLARTDGDSGKGGT